MKRNELLGRIKQGQYKFEDVDIYGDYIFEELDNLVFENCIIVADLSSSNMKNTSFRYCNLKTSIFRNCNFHNTEFISCTLCGTDFNFSTLDHANFIDCYYHSFLIEDRSKLKDNNDFGIFIDRLSKGWFDFKLTFNLEYIHIGNSGFLLDTMDEFLNSLIQIIKMESSVEWNVWNDEPGAMIYRLQLIDSNINLTIFDSSEESDIVLHSNNYKGYVNEILFDVIIHKELFIKRIVTLFERIIRLYGSKFYECNWGRYPKEKLDTLLKYIG